MKMRFLVAILWCLVHLVESESSSNYSWKEKYIEVPVDHFNYVTNATFRLRYLYNDTYFHSDDGSPILFYCGNEGDIETFAKNTGFMWEIAPSLNALLIFAEHRYYGKSLPFGNFSFDSPQHFGYLTVEQTLADYAELIDELTHHRNDIPVIAIGGSYGGMLAAWFRMKYPHHVTGALAASAPIFQFGDLVACDIYSRITTAVYRTALNANCSDNIKQSWSVFKNYMANESNRTHLNSIFKFCKGQELSKVEDLERFMDYLEDVYSNIAMANYPYPNEFLAPMPAYPVRQFCFYLSKKFDKDEDLLEALQSALSIYTNFTGTTKCLDYTSAYSPDIGGLAWDIQTCNEIVMPMCVYEEDNMFREKKWDFQAYSDTCYQRFKIRPRKDDILVRYGGRHIGGYTNIIFSNGLLDPWCGGGVLRTTNQDIDIVIVPEGAHHLDLRAKNPEDPVSVQVARKRELKIITKWVKNYLPPY